MTADLLRKIIGKNIKYNRLLNGYTQEKLCEKTATSVTHLREIENGKTNISLNKLSDFINILNITDIKTILDDKILSVKFPNNITEFNEWKKSNKII